MAMTRAMRPWLRSLALLPIFICVAVSSAGAADSRALTAARHRQDVMDQLANDVKLIKKYLGGGASRTEGAKAAADIVAVAAVIDSLFPPGTGSDAFPGKSVAKPDIWDNPDDFHQIEGVLVTDAGALSTAVSHDDKGGALTAFQSMGRDACGACHQTYRGRRDAE